MSAIASRRSTTSSRKPGRPILGTVYVRRALLERCPDCGVRTFVRSPLHGAHLVQAACGHWDTVNCRGVRLVECLCGGAP